MNFVEISSFKQSRSRDIYSRTRDSDEMAPTVIHVATKEEGAGIERDLEAVICFWTNNHVVSLLRGASAQR